MDMMAHSFIQEDDGEGADRGLGVFLGLGSF
jgi:hypothetical protein